MARPAIVPRLAAAALLLAVTPVRSAAAGLGCYPPPVAAPVARPFEAPACDYCPGHRGLDYASRAGQPVLAVAAGEVSFSGLVARVRYVVVEQDDGRRATYGRLRSSSALAGARVDAGDTIGTASDLTFFGLRQGERYLDPAPWIGRWRRPPRLVPVDGSAGRSAPPAQLTCGNRRHRR